MVGYWRRGIVTGVLWWGIVVGYWRRGIVVGYWHRGIVTGGIVVGYCGRVLA